MRCICSVSSPASSDNIPLRSSWQTGHPQQSQHPRTLHQPRQRPLCTQQHQAAIASFDKPSASTPRLRRSPQHVASRSTRSANTRPPSRVSTMPSCFSRARRTPPPPRTRPLLAPPISGSRRQLDQAILLKPDYARPATTVAARSTNSSNTRPHWRVSTAQFSSTRTTPRPTATAPTPSMRSTNTRKPLPVATAPSRSTPTSPKPGTIAAILSTPPAISRGAAGLRPIHPSQTWLRGSHDNLGTVLSELHQHQARWTPSITPSCSSPASSRPTATAAMHSSNSASIRSPSRVSPPPCSSIRTATMSPARACT